MQTSNDKWKKRERTVTHWAQTTPHTLLPEFTFESSWRLKVFNFSSDSAYTSMRTVLPIQLVKRRRPHLKQVGAATSNHVWNRTAKETGHFNIVTNHLVRSTPLPAISVLPRVEVLFFKSKITEVYADTRSIKTTFDFTAYIQSKRQKSLCYVV